MRKMVLGDLYSAALMADWLRDRKRTFLTVPWEWLV